LSIVARKNAVGEFSFTLSARLRMTTLSRVCGNLLWVFAEPEEASGSVLDEIRARGRGADARYAFPLPLTRVMIVS
jgi:hypothetical protein